MKNIKQKIQDEIEINGGCWKTKQGNVVIVAKYGKFYNIQVKQYDGEIRNKMEIDCQGYNKREAMEEVIDCLLGLNVDYSWDINWAD